MKASRAGIGRAAALTLGLLALLPAGAAAAPGDLDPSFGGDGLVTVDFGGSDSSYAMLVQPDGKVVAGGFEGVGGDMAFTRLLADGTPDPGFGTAGRASVDFGPNAVADDLALDQLGRLLATGSVGTQYGVTRLGTTGGLDGSFAGDGTFIGNFGAPYTMSATRGIVSYPDGRIGVGGHAYAAPNYDFAAARLSSAGDYDNSFGGDGRTAIDLGTDFDVGSNAVLQADGKLLVAGITGSPNYDCGVARFTDSGAPDAGAFGGPGFVLRDTGGREYCDGIGLDAQGRILLGGRREIPSTQDFFAARLGADGAFDPGFGGAGFFVGGLPGPDSGTAVAAQPDGKVLVAGATGGPGPNFVLARLTAGGGLDPSFSGDGIAFADFGRDDYPNGVAVMPGGDIVVAGSTNDSGSDGDFALARFQGGPLEIDVTAKRKQRVKRLLATIYCSLPCDAALRGKGRAGGDKFKTKQALGSVAAAQTATLRLKLKRRDKRELAGEKGKVTVKATATSGEYTVTDSVKLKLKR